MAARWHGWFYGVQGTGGHALDEGHKVGPDVNSYSDFAGVFWTGVFVTGVADTSISGPAGVYGQMGEDPASIPEKMIGAVIGAANEWPGVAAWSTQAHGVLASSRDSIGVEGRSLNSIGIFGSGQLNGVVGSLLAPPMQGPMPIAPTPRAGMTGISGGAGPPALPGFSTIPGVFGTST